MPRRSIPSTERVRPPRGRPPSPPERVRPHRVVTFVTDAEMATQAGEILAEIDVDNAVVQEGAPEAGDAKHGPYDVIFVNGGVETLPPALLDQLKEGGRLVAIHMTGALGQCQVTIRAGDKLTTRRVFDATAPVLSGFQAAKDFTF